MVPVMKRDDANSMKEGSRIQSILIEEGNNYAKIRCQRQGNIPRDDVAAGDALLSLLLAPPIQAAQSSGGRCASQSARERDSESER